MISDFKEYMKFLIRKKLTPNQFAICYMIETRDIENIRAYERELGAFRLNDFKYLEDTGYIENFNIDTPEQRYNIANLIVTEKFRREVFIDSEQAFEELIKIWPKKGSIQGKEYSMLKNLDKAELYYAKKILKRNRYKHEEIKRKTVIFVEQIKSGKLPPRGLDVYILGQQWRDIDDEDSNRKDTVTSL